MRKALLCLILLPFILPAAEELEYDRWYSSVAAGMLLPGGGSSLSQSATVNARFGYFLSESFAVESEFSVVPNAVSKSAGNQTLVGWAAQGVWHFMGYERFDPFLTFGVASFFGSRHVFEDNSFRNAFGPTVGIGALYHLTDHLALRADARGCMSVGTPAGVLFDVSLGMQYSFGEKSFSSLFFESGSEVVAEEVYVIADGMEDSEEEKKVIRALKKNKKLKAVIKGHIDCRLGMGKERARRISLERAEKVKAKFLAAGISEERMEVEGLGFSQPRVKFDFRKGAPLNNRVEVLLLESEQ